MSLLPLFAILVFVFNLSSISLAHTQHPCYYSPNQLASDSLLPCYSSTYSNHYSCCMAGDVCLEHNACYDAGTGVTYQYACTDPTFQDESCPNKCGLDIEKSPWVGLVFCDGSDRMPNNTWVCNHPDNCVEKDNCTERVWDAGLKNLGHVGCKDLKHDEEHIAFHGISMLSDIVVLPPSSKLSSWWSQHQDRVKSTVVSTPTLHADKTPNSVSDSIHATPIVSTRPLPTSTAPSITTSALSLFTPIPSPPPHKGPEIPTSKRSALAISISLSLGIPILLCLICTGTYFYVKQKRQTQCPPCSLTNDNNDDISNDNNIDSDNEKQTPPPAEPTHELEASSPATITTTTTTTTSNAPLPPPKRSYQPPTPVLHAPPPHRPHNNNSNNINNSTPPPALQLQPTQPTTQNSHNRQQSPTPSPPGHAHHTPGWQLHGAHPAPVQVQVPFRNADADAHVDTHVEEKHSSGEQVVDVYLENPYAYAYAYARARARAHGYGYGYGYACGLRECEALSRRRW